MRTNLEGPLSGFSYGLKPLASSSCLKGLRQLPDGAGSCEGTGSWLGVLPGYFPGQTASPPPGRFKGMLRRSASNGKRVCSRIFPSSTQDSWPRVARDAGSALAQTSPLAHIVASSGHPHVAQIGRALVQFAISVSPRRSTSICYPKSTAMILRRLEAPLQVFSLGLARCCVADVGRGSPIQGAPLVRTLTL